jgi:hypothetical protein
MFFARDFNDKNLFITDIPVNVTRHRQQPERLRLPGIQSQHGHLRRQRVAQHLRAGVADRTARHRGSRERPRRESCTMFGSNLDLHLTDGIALSNKLMYSAGDVDCYCLFNNFAPQTLSSFIAGEIGP